MTLYISALLGTPPSDSDHTCSELWFLSDFVFARCLLTDETSEFNQSWLAQIDVFAELEKLRNMSSTSTHTLLHGPSRSQRFELDTKERFYDVWEKAKSLRQAFLKNIAKQARYAKATDHIVILLFGHGPGNKATFGRIECGEKGNGKTLWLERSEVEKALGTTRARVSVSVVSTACFAGTWASTRWALFAAPGTSYSIALPPSGSPPEPCEHVHRLEFSDVQEAFERTTADNTTSHNVTSHDTHDGFSVAPSVPTNEQWGGWHEMLGIQASINVVLKANNLPRQPLNPPQPPELEESEEPRSSTTGSRPRLQTVEDDEPDSADNNSSESELSSSSESSRSSQSTHSTSEEPDVEELGRLLDRWEKTRPANLYIAARSALLASVRRCRAGTASLDERQRLLRQFQRRAGADELAQRLAEDAGIALQIRCEDYTEVDGLPDCHGVKFTLVHWGKLAPRDLVDRLRQPYKRAGQWIFNCWTESGKDRSVLETILEKVGGGVSTQWNQYVD
ncbi:hypothetical protein FB451DRAFT_1205319 [Mycena latifolia]|nr:hypothetical protein FB451DRAFT_1205319 [Mycena latifolia]